MWSTLKIKKYRRASSQSRQFIRLGCWLACKWTEQLGNTAYKSYTRCRSNAMSNELENTNFPFRSTRPFELLERSSELENWASLLSLVSCARKRDRHVVLVSLTPNEGSKNEQLGLGALDLHTRSTTLEIKICRCTQRRKPSKLRASVAHAVKKTLPSGEPLYLMKTKMQIIKKVCFCTKLFKSTIFTMYEWRFQRYRICLQNLEIRISIEKLNFF